MSPRWPRSRSRLAVGKNFGPAMLRSRVFSSELEESSGSPLDTTGDGHSYYSVKGNLRFMSGNNYSHVTSARHGVGNGGVDGAQVRRGAFAGTMTNGRRRVGFPVCVLERKLARFFFMANSKRHNCGKQKVGHHRLKVTNRSDPSYKLSIVCRRKFYKSE